MQYYSNLAGGSAIDAYEIGDDHIKVKFSNGNTYTYTYSSAGRENVEVMKMLAKSGKGLNRFISKTVKNKHTRRLKLW